MKRFLKIVGVAAGLFFLTAGAAYGQEDCSKLSFMDDVSRKPRTDLPFQISEMRRLRPEDICKKKEGWFPTGLPLLNSDPNVGVGYGVRVFLINNGKKTDPFFEYTPYRFRMFAQYFNTTKNRQYQDISFDAPYIFDTKWRLRGDLIYDTNPNTLYYGIGERSLQNLSYQERNQPGGEIARNSTYHEREKNIYFTRPGGPGDPIDFQGANYSGFPVNDAFRVTDRMYNRYDIRSPQFNLSGEHIFFGGLVRMVAGLRVSQNTVKTFDGQFVKSRDPLTEGTPFSNSGMTPNGKTKVTEDADAGKIIGANGGNVNSVRFGLVLDTRDLEPDPNRGIFLEATYEKIAKSFGSDFQYSKYFTQIKLFYSPFPKVFDKLVIAGRGAFGLTEGEAPFFEYRNLWSTEGGITGLGGLRTLRGYKQDRFTGKAMGWGNVELRWKFFDFNVAGQHFALNLVPFVDFGRVWDDEHNVGLKDYKYSRGLGFRIAWNQSTILMLDYAVSKEDKQIFMNFNHIFEGVMEKYKNIIILVIALFLYTNCEEKPDDTTLGFINEDTKVLLAGMLIFNSYSTNLASETITDFTSGLMWKICTQGQVLRVGQNSQYDCEGINDASTIIGRYGASLFQYCSLNLNDCNTISLPPALVGQTPGFSGVSEAYNSCSQDRTGQHSDWRLPTLPELKVLTGSGSLNAFLIKFPNTVEDYYWTSWAQEGTVDTARAVNFEATHFGEDTTFTKTSRYFVRCVRNLP